MVAQFDAAVREGVMTARDFGPKPEFAELPVADLAVDPSYQRSIEQRRSQAAIERTCENFRWSLFGIVTVTKGLSGYLIIDGQHRTEAARRLKIATVPCLIVPAMSRKDQALAFVAQNRDRIPVTQFGVHHALAVAGDENAMALQAMCEAADVEIPHYPIPANKSKPCQTLAIGACRALLVARGQKRGADLLKAVRLAFVNEAGALRAPLISALAIVDAAVAIDTGKLRFALERIGAKGFDKRCNASLSQSASSKTRTQAAASVLTRLLAEPLPATTPSAKPASKPTPPQVGDAPFIKAPSKAQLMGRR
jgi:hypothetical protein